MHVVIMWQVDQPLRGFSFMQDGPLDMRMSQQGESAELLVNSADEAHLGQILRDFGEERAWRSIASRCIIAQAVPQLCLSTFTFLPLYVT